MDELWTKIDPDFLVELTTVIAFFAEIFAAGVLLAFLIWVVGFVCREVFRWLETMSKEGG